MCPLPDDYNKYDIADNEGADKSGQDLLYVDNGSIQ